MTVTTEVLAPTFVLYENDQKVTDKALLGSVVRITVDERLDQAGVALVEFSDRGLALSQGSHFGVGTSLKLELGYVGNTDVLFDGEVTAWRESFPRRGVPVLVVVALDRFHRLRRERKNKTFCSMKDSDIVRQVLGGHSLQVEADATDVTHDYVIQANQSDADFLLARAGLNGYELKIDGKKAAFRKPKLDDSAAVTLKWHEDLTSFTTIVSLANAHAAVQASGYDMKQKQAVSSKAEAGSESSSMGGQKTGNQVLKDRLSASEPTADPFRPLLTQEEASLLANATLNRDAKKFVTGEGTVVGNTQVRRGAVIEIDGIGDYLSGNYYVQTAIHTLLPRLGYTTVFRVQKTSVQQKKAPPQKQGEQGQPPAPPPEATGAVEFVVRNQFDEPVEGLEYVLYCPDGEKKTGTIPANGVVREENAKGGLYKLALKGVDPPLFEQEETDDDPPPDQGSAPPPADDDDDAAADAPAQAPPSNGTKFKLQLCDETYFPCANRPYTLELPSGEKRRGTTDASGHLEQTLPPDATKVKVRYKPKDGGKKVELELHVSNADPESDEYLTAQIKNFGFALPNDTDSASIMRFQAACGLPPTGTLDDKTKQAVQRAIEGGPQSLRGVIFEDGESG